jgi:hypothetical protein
MHEYEIRIFKWDRTPYALIEVIHLNDHAAIRQARKIAKARPFEVWRGLNCVYGEYNGPPFDSTPSGEAAYSIPYFR